MPSFIWLATYTFFVYPFSVKVQFSTRMREKHKENKQRKPQTQTDEINFVPKGEKELTLKRDMMEVEYPTERK